MAVYAVAINSSLVFNFAVITKAAVKQSCKLADSCLATFIPADQTAATHWRLLTDWYSGGNHSHRHPHTSNCVNAHNHF